MKKWSIITLVLMGCLLLAIQYLVEKKTKEPPAPVKTEQVEPTDAPLNPSATGYSISETPFAASSYDAGYSSPLQLPNVPMDYKGACPGGSLSEMSASYGKYWGFSAKETPVSQNDTRTMYAFLADYTACVAVSRDDSRLCNTLPSEPGNDSVSVNAKRGLRYKCGKKVSLVQFISYMAGKSRNRDSCPAVLANWSQTILAKISVPDFCEAAARGQEAVTDYMLKSGVMKKKGKKNFAKVMSRSFCGGDAECPNGVTLYNAVKGGDVSRCPRSISSFCEAAINRSPASCEPIVREMSKFYCASVERTKKKNGGYIGMTRQEIEADIAQKELQKAEEERRKATFNEISAEMNKGVKKILKKQ